MLQITGHHQTVAAVVAASANDYNLTGLIQPHAEGNLEAASLPANSIST